VIAIAIAPIATAVAIVAALMSPPMPPPLVTVARARA
jgi:hypothetical protein